MFIASYCFISLQPIPIVPPAGGGLQIRRLILGIIIRKRTVGTIVCISITGVYETHIFCCPALTAICVRNFFPIGPSCFCHMDL